VAVNGTTAFVGAPYKADSGWGTGAAYIFEFDGMSWNAVAKLLPADVTGYDFFGRDVSVDGEYAVVTANGDTDNGLESGSAYVYRYTGGIWTEYMKIIASDGGEHDFFGQSVRIRGDQFIIGTQDSNINGDAAGAAYIYAEFTPEPPDIPATGPISLALLILIMGSLLGARTVMRK